jgi:hypothetical protein
MSEREAARLAPPTSLDDHEDTALANLEVLLRLKSILPKAAQKVAEALAIAATSSTFQAGDLRRSRTQYRCAPSRGVERWFVLSRRGW